MKVVIVGAGTVGFQLARQLVDERRDVVIVETDPVRAQEVADRLDCLVINEPGNSLATLKDARVDRADFFICVTDSDEVNMISCALVHNNLGLPIKIARVRSIEYSQSKIFQEETLGIDCVVNPDVEAAQAIVRSIEAGATSDVMVFERSHLQLRTLTIDRNSPLIDKSMEEMRSMVQLNYLVALISRDGSVTIPSGDSTIYEGDLLYIVAHETTFKQLNLIVGHSIRDLQQIILVGGGKIGVQIAERLLNIHEEKGPLLRRIMRNGLGMRRRRKLTLVERDPEKCRRLVQMFPSALVLNADISDEALYEEENFSQADLLIAATEDEELNIVTAIYVKTLGIDRTIALVSRSGYASIATKLGIDVVVSVKNTVVSTIMKHIRWGMVRSIHNISDGAVEAIELTVGASSMVAGRRIQEIKLPPASLIVSINRNGEDHIPGGEDTIEAQDHVILITVGSR